MIKDDKCEKCKYNTNDYVCHPHCSVCDGKSHFVSKKPLKQILVDGLKKIRANIATTEGLVDAMCSIADELKTEKRHINGNNGND